VRLGRARARGGAVAAAALFALALTACGGGSRDGEPEQRSAEAVLGEKVFNDTSLSASGRQSCATCHVAAAGHAQDNASPAQFGGEALDRQGGRVTPTIRYLATSGPFRMDSGGTPSGGFFWDGRAASLADQAGRPFLNPVEMALPSKAELAARLQRAPYAGEFVRLYGANIFSRPDDLFLRTTEVLQRFQLEDPQFQPFSSKYDEVLRGNATLDAAEQRGLALFNDSRKGNCLSCHPSQRRPDGTLPLFTNFNYHVLGVPRNAALAANADPAYFDLGLCAREGGDLAARTDLCGAFKVPTLRNVALRKAFFHNGRFTALEEVLAFYAQRDTHPERFYPLRGDNAAHKFDDLPRHLHGNVVRGEAPYDRQVGGVPALSDADLADLAAFLRTLTDGWRP